MAEAKRVTLTQIGSEKPKEKKDKPRLCHRFVLSLVDSTEKTCPEFSFVDLLKNATDGKDDFSEDENDPFSGQDRADHDKMVALAKSFEEKYAQPQSTKKPKKSCLKRVHEYVDLGDGYDETDPFIDNAEAYDELVPSCLTTQHGGFYINSGKLDFRAVSDDDDVFQSAGKKRRKKNVITSDPESADESIKKRGPKKRFKDDDDIKKKKRKKLSSGDLSDKSLAKRKKLDKEKFKSFKMKKKQKHTVADLLISAAPTPQPNGVSGRQSPSTLAPVGDVVERDHMPATALANLDSAIDSVISMARIHDPSEESDASRSMSPTPSGAPHSSELVPRLPDNLPGNILQLVTQLKQAAKESEAGKCKFFCPRVNNWLLDIENESRKLRCSNRTAIYHHLASYLPCGKETLIKRAKKLRLDQTDDKLRDPISKIKEAINFAMPSLVEKHQCEVDAVQKQKIDRLQERQDLGSTESDEEGDKQDGDKQKRIMAPRKKFEWTNTTRSLLNNIVRVKMESYEQSKVRAQAPEEYLKTYLEQELKPLWPQGWIQTRMLFKESRAVHGRWTAGSRPRKPLILPGTSNSKSTTPSGTPSSKPGTPVTNVSTVSLLTTNTMTTPSSSLTSGTVLTPSVQKDSKNIPRSLSLSSDSSSNSSGASSSPTKTSLENTQENHTSSKDSKTAFKSDLVASKPKPTINTKPADLKAAGSLGFDTSDSGKVSVKDNAICAQKPSNSIARPQAPPMIHVPKAPVTAAEDTTMSFLEQFYQFATGVPRAMDNAKVAVSKTSTQVDHLKHPPPASVSVQQAQCREDKRTAMTSSVSVSGSCSLRPVSAAEIQAMMPNVNANKPHLAAALQGVYIPASSGAVSQDVKVTTHQGKVSTSQVPQRHTTVSHVTPQVSRTLSVSLNDLNSAIFTQGQKAKLLSNAPRSTTTQKHPEQSMNEQKTVNPVQTAKLKQNHKEEALHGHKNVSLAQPVNHAVHTKQTPVPVASVVKSVNAAQSSRSANSTMTHPGSSTMVSGTTRVTSHMATNSTHGNVHTLTTALSNQPKPTGQVHRVNLPQTQRTSPAQKYCTSPPSQNPSKSHSQANNAQRPTSTYSSKVGAFAVPAVRPPLSASKHIEHEHVSSTSGISSQTGNGIPLHLPGQSDARSSANSAFSPKVDRKQVGISHSLHSPTSRSITSAPMPHSIGSTKLYTQKPATTVSMIHSAVSSTTNNEPKFGGLTLSQIQEQTLKASQKAHIQTAQYPTQSTSVTSPYAGNVMFGSPSRHSQGLPGYQGMSPPTAGLPSSPTVRQSPEQGYSPHRAHQGVSPRNPLHNPAQSPHRY